MPLKVLTLNLWHDAGPYARRRELIRESIDRLDPDLIGFQEVLRRDGFDQARELLDGRGYHLDFVRATEFWEKPGGGFGNAIASRWLVLDRAERVLPDAGDEERRAALSVTVDSPFGHIPFTTTHLNWKLHHGWVRERQVVALCDFVLERRRDSGFPPIITGDFNADPDSTEIRYVSGLHALDGRGVSFRDAWKFAGDGGPGATWSSRNPWTHGLLEPDRRIDYIFAGYPLANAMGAIERCRVVCDDGRDGVFPSDHFGLYAEFRTEPWADA